MLFTALVLQKQCCLLRCFYRNGVFIALVYRNNVVYCSGFTEILLFIALVLQEQCCLLLWFYKNLIIHYGTFFFIILLYESLTSHLLMKLSEWPVLWIPTAQLQPVLHCTKSGFASKTLVHPGSCDHQTHFCKGQLLTITAVYTIAAVFESYASTVSKLKGYGMVKTVSFAVTKLLSTSGSSRSVAWFTSIATELAPVGKKSELYAVSATTWKFTSVPHIDHITFNCLDISISLPSFIVHAILAFRIDIRGVAIK